jgi:tRNA (guanine37-N1)-methyltransferase
MDGSQQGQEQGEFSTPECPNDKFIHADSQVQEKLRVSEIDGHAFIKSAPELAWTQPFAPHVPRGSSTSTREEQKAARKERERRKAEGLPPLPAAPVEPAPTPKPRLPDHYIMNLPDSALSFLPSFPSSYTALLSNESFKEAYPDIESVPMPLIHVYCFTREMEPEAAQKDIIEVSLMGMGDANDADT